MKNQPITPTTPANLTPFSKAIKRIVAVASATFFTFSSPASAALTLPSEMTERDVVILTAMATTQMDMLAIVEYENYQLNSQTQDLGFWTGTIDATGWNLTFNGSLNSIPLLIHQQGTLDFLNASAAWTTAGTYGVAPIDGSGSIAYDPNWTSLLQIFGKIMGLTGDVIDIYDDNPNTSKGKIKIKVETSGGTIVEIDGEVSEETTPETSSSTVTINEKGIQIRTDGTVNSNGSTTFHNEILPEPSAPILLSMGAVLLFLKRRRIAV